MSATATSSRPDVVPYPDEVAARYLAAGVWGPHRIEELLHHAVQRWGDRTAVVEGERSWTYREFAASVDRVRVALAAQGVETGDAVVLQLPNGADFLACTYALLGLGARPVFALPAHRETELVHLVSGSRARFHLTVTEVPGGDSTSLTLDDLDPGAADPPPPGAAPVSASGAEDVAFLQLSGGTTGLPKLIARTHRDYVYSFLRSAEVCRVEETTVFLAVLPMSHNFTMSSPGFFAVLSLGGTVVTTTDPSPATVFDLVARHRVTMVAAVPPLVQLWLDAPAREGADLTSLDVVLVGGARFAEATARRVRPELGCDLQQVYGMAEGLVCYTRRDDPHDRVVATQGRPMSDLDEVRVVDDEDRPVPLGTPGHVQARGPYTIRGYYAAPEHDAVAFTADGFYRTGDVATLDEAGNLTVVGRSKEQINRGGEKVAPAEVEALLLALDTIHDVCVVGVPDDVLGERVEAYVVAHPGRAGELTTPAVRRHLRGRVADHKIPERVHLVDHLPGTAVGKVSRRGVAARYFQPTDGER